MVSKKQDIDAIVFKAGQIKAFLEVSTGTIRRWVYRYPDFFSDFSKDEDRYKVCYTPDDALIIATIQYLSSKGNSLDKIEEELRAGVRHGEDRIEDLVKTSDIASKVYKSGSTSSLSHFELKQTRQERDQTLDRLHQLEEKYTAKDQEVTVLLRELAELKYQLGITQGKLEALETYFLREKATS